MSYWSCPIIWILMSSISSNVYYFDVGHRFSLSLFCFNLYLSLPGANPSITELYSASVRFIPSRRRFSFISSTEVYLTAGFFGCDEDCASCALEILACSTPTAPLASETGSWSRNGDGVLSVTGSSSGDVVDEELPSNSPSLSPSGSTLGALTAHAGGTELAGSAVSGGGLGYLQ